MSRLINMLSVVFLLVILSCACGKPAVTPLPTEPTGPTLADVTVTYVGNAGFMVAVGEKKVLIDAIFSGISSEYTLPQSVQDLLTSAQPPFDDIDLVLVTHDHGDHFNASMVRQHMENDPSTVFLSTSQAASQVSGFDGRVQTLDPRTGSPVEADLDGIHVEAIYISHGYPPGDPDEIFNNGYLVTIGTVTFFHTGDVGDLGDVSPYALAGRGIDLGFLSHFYFHANTQSYLEDLVGAEYWIPIHYYYTTPAFNPRTILAAFPEAVLFTSELETWSPLPPADCDCAELKNP